MTKEEWLEKYSLSEDSNLIYGSGQAYQIKFFEDLAKKLNLELTYESFHHSKSVPLPVVSLKISDNGKIYIRNNFHNFECVYKGPSLKIDPGVLYELKDEEWYQKEIERARNYMKGRRGALRHPPDFSTLDWYEEWSSGKLERLDEETLIRVPCLYLEGISRVLDMRIGCYSCVANSELFGWSNWGAWESLEDQIRHLMNAWRVVVTD